MKQLEAIFREFKINLKLFFRLAKNTDLKTKKKGKSFCVFVDTVDGVVLVRDGNIPVHTHSIGEIGCGTYSLFSSFESIFQW